MISMIVAMGNNNEIGIKNTLPWSMPADLAYFKKVTTGHKIVMGRKTYESIGRPLPNRENIILTRQHDFQDDRVCMIHSLEEIKKYRDSSEETFVIGGAEIFKEIFPYAEKLYVTKIHGDFHADTYFPVMNENEWVLISEDAHENDDKNQYAYTFCVYVRKN